MKFSLEAIVSCDDRGQVVLPKEIRKQLEISPGEKMAVLRLSKGEVCFLTLIKADSLQEVIKGFMGPVITDMIK